MNLKEKRAAALKAASDLVSKAKSEGRDLTADEIETVNAKLAEVDDLDARIKSADESSALLKRLGSLAVGDGFQPSEDAPRNDASAKSLGEHFVKHTGERLRQVRGVKGASVSAPEFKAATDVQGTGNAVYGPVLTQVDRTIVTGVRPRLVIADLLGSGALSGTAIQYFVEGAMEGAFTTVAEGAQKPQLHFADPHTVTDALKKIAGFIRLTDEMIEDLDFVVSEINTRLLYELGRFEEQQLLIGNGQGTNLLGLLNRAGIQTQAATDPADNADAIFRALTQVQTGSGLDADGVAINPLDYQSLRLSRDANGQYFGGGFFQPPYGETPGVMSVQQPVWGLRTVVTPAVAQGTAVVGAFAQAATVYRKGGVRVESTNSHEDDFTNNRVTIRAEERLALAVRVPAAFVRVTFAAA